MIDTENGRGELYSTLCEYDVVTIGAPYTVQKYLHAIHDAESSGYDVQRNDGLSPAWNGDGVLLYMHVRIADQNRMNSFAAWRQVTPLHNKLVEAILASPYSKCV